MTPPHRRVSRQAAKQHVPLRRSWRATIKSRPWLDTRGLLTGSTSHILQFAIRLASNAQFAYETRRQHLITGIALAQRNQLLPYTRLNC